MAHQGTEADAHGHCNCGCHADPDRHPEPDTIAVTFPDGCVHAYSHTDCDTCFIPDPESDDAA